MQSMTITKIPFDGITGEISRGTMPRGLDNDQNQKDLVSKLNNAAIKVIVVLCPEKECKDSGTDLLKFYSDNNFTVVHFPIPDFGVPESNEFFSLIDKIHQFALNGQNVLVHCMSGIGRTGLVLASLKRKIEGIKSAGEAIQSIRKYVPSAVDSTAQMRLIAKLPPEDNEFLTSNSAFYNLDTTYRSSGGSILDNVFRSEEDGKYDKSRNSYKYNSSVNTNEIVSSQNKILRKLDEISLNQRFFNRKIDEIVAGQKLSHKAQDKLFWAAKISTGLKVENEIAKNQRKLLTVASLVLTVASMIFYYGTVASLIGSATPLAIIGLLGLTAYQFYEWKSHKTAVEHAMWQYSMI